MNETYGNNFAVSITSEEFFEDYTYLSKQDCGLKYGLYVDSGQAYLRFNHPLCIYAIATENGVNEHSQIFPIVISENPECVVKCDRDFSDVFEFIKNNLALLKCYADMIISSPEFYCSIGKTKPNII